MNNARCLPMPAPGACWRAISGDAVCLEWRTFLFDPPLTSLVPARDYYAYAYLPACASRSEWRGSLLNRPDLSPRCRVPSPEKDIP